MTLATRAVLNSIVFCGVIAAFVIAPSLPLTYWEGWVYSALLAVSVMSITLYFLKRDPALIERRLKAGPGAETRPLQRVLQTLATIAFFAAVVVPALDRRFHWSPRVPLALIVAGDVMTLLGFATIFFVYRANSYTAATITVEREQEVITTGPYRFVRHPMYAGALVFLTGTALALGSWIALVPVAVVIGVIVVRLLDEEKFLAGELRGYDEYRKRVRFRLIPFVW